MNFMKWMEEEVGKDKKRIDKALRDNRVKEFLEQNNLGLDDLKEADRRIQMLGIRNSAKRKALRDIEVLKLLFSLLEPDGTMEFKEFLDWSAFVIGRYK